MLGGWQRKSSPMSRAWEDAEFNVTVTAGSKPQDPGYKLTKPEKGPEKWVSQYKHGVNSLTQVKSPGLTKTGLSEYVCKSGTALGEMRNRNFWKCVGQLAFRGRNSERCKVLDMVPRL